MAGLDPAIPLRLALGVLRGIAGTPYPVMTARGAKEGWKDMSKKAFDKIAEGLTDALSTARGETKPAKLHIPPEIEDADSYRLTDEQVAEVKRRRADPNRKLLTLEEANVRVSRLIGK